VPGGKPNPHEGGYLRHVAIGLDIFVNALTGGHAGETISSRLGKRRIARGGKLRWSDWGGLAKPLDWVLDRFEPYHSLRSVQEDEGEPVRPPLGGNPK
jgi:hypothetical protein